MKPCALLVKVFKILTVVYVAFFIIQTIVWTVTYEFFAFMGVLIVMYIIIRKHPKCWGFGDPPKDTEMSSSNQN